MDRKNLQDAFLCEVRRERIPVTIYTINGVRMTAIVKGYDPFVVILDVDGSQQMIYKHAISTIIPKFRLIEVNDGLTTMDGET